jgi:16S rRNA C967 or C1407 C5-methylase (RsmB/RsmF family)/NOL1/NOP2/fmu family ribosome biogenesis protein
VQLPSSLIHSLQSTKGFEETAFINIHQSGEQITSIRINPAKQSISTPLDGLQPHPSTTLRAASVPWSSLGYYLHQRPSFTLDPLLHAGTYYVQEASSMFLEQAVKQTTDTSQPLMVLDLCAAPGGKSTLLQSVISNQSLLVSNEVIQSRVNILKENIIKWGSGNVIVTNNDPKDFSKLSGLFDVVVIDAPCSGSGLFRRDPEAINEWSEANVQLCSQRQQRIIADAWNCLKEEGVLIYSTCSYSTEEDEAILDWTIKGLKAEGIRLKVEEEWGIDEVQSSTGTYGYRFWPYKVKGEGFFIAAFRKKEATGELRMKTKKEAIPSKEDINIVSKWLQSTDGLSFILQGQNIAIVPSAWHPTIQYLMQELKVRYAGVELGTIAKNDLLPEHSLGLSTIISNHIFSVELTQEQALNYLRKSDVQIESSHKGWALAQYKGMNLGWMKLLGNRINNYYPKEYRILHH